MTETKTSIAFSLKEFTTSRQQQFEISLQQSTMDEFNATIQKIGLDELKVKVNETKNRVTIYKFFLIMVPFLYNKIFNIIRFKIIIIEQFFTS